MIQIIYTINLKDRNDELKWLNDQKIYPKFFNAWDFMKDIPVLKVGIIIPPEMATLIKLRHKIDSQSPYTK